jgi:hypothetical protein
MGRTSKTPLYTIATCLLIAIVAATSEYVGAIDLVPDFGRDNPELKVPDFQSYISHLQL